MLFYIHLRKRVIIINDVLNNNFSRMCASVSSRRSTDVVYKLGINNRDIIGIKLNRNFIRSDKKKKITLQKTVGL